MKRRNRRKAPPLPVMLGELMLASWETIARRALLMAQNSCPPAEYQRMVREKMMATALSGRRLISGGRKASMTSVLAPWHGRAVGNVRRLRKKASRHSRSGS